MQRLIIKIFEIRRHISLIFAAGGDSIVGACSVVTKNIPDNGIWAGKPRLFYQNNKVR